VVVGVVFDAAEIAGGGGADFPDRCGIGIIAGPPPQGDQPFLFQNFAERSIPHVVDPDARFDEDQVLMHVPAPGLLEVDDRRTGWIVSDDDVVRIQIAVNDATAVRALPVGREQCRARRGKR